MQKSLRVYDITKSHDVVTCCDNIAQHCGVMTRHSKNWGKGTQNHENESSAKKLYKKRILFQLQPLIFYT